MKIDRPQDLFLLELQDMYSAETQIVQALPKMIRASYDKKLKESLEVHLEETKEHVSRLLSIGSLLDMEVEGETCEGAQGLLKEGEEAMRLTGDPTLLDEALISGARKVEHYELIGYTTLIMLAKLMKAKEVIELLQQSLNEEEEADKKLATIAKSAERTDILKKIVEDGKEMISRII